MVTLTYLIGELEQSIAGQTSLTGLNITHIWSWFTAAGVASSRKEFSVFKIFMQNDRLKMSRFSHFSS